MRDAKSVVLAVVCLLAGVLLAREFSRDVGAQEQQFTEAQAWEVHHGSYSSMGDSDARFYIIRHNRLTGETQYVGCEDRDGCTRLAVEVQGP